MHQHRGELLEAIVRRSGYSLKALSEKLGVSRNTVYNKFKEYNLSYDFIVRVGEIIHYDFTYEYPAIKTKLRLNTNQSTSDLWRLERKYSRVLESYNGLLNFLLRMANDYHLTRLQKEIEKLPG